MTLSSLPLLYTYRRCPYAMRARMALLVAGIEFDAHEIVLRDKPGAMLAVSPKGTVPVLQTPDGGVIEQSLEIMQWAFARRDPGGWWPRAQTRTNRELLAVCDGPFKHHLDRYKYPERFEGEGSPLLHRDAAVEKLMRPLDAQLQCMPQLGGPTPCATDIAIYPFVRQFAAVDHAAFAELALPTLQAWLAGWMSHPLFGAAMVKIPSGRPVRFPQGPTVSRR